MPARLFVGPTYTDIATMHPPPVILENETVGHLAHRVNMMHYDMQKQFSGVHSLLSAMTHRLTDFAEQINKTIQDNSRRMQSDLTFVTDKLNAFNRHSLEQRDKVDCLAQQMQSLTKTERDQSFALSQAVQEVSILNQAALRDFESLLRHPRAEPCVPKTVCCATQTQPQQQSVKPKSKPSKKKKKKKSTKEAHGDDPEWLILNEAFRQTILRKTWDRWRAVAQRITARMKDQDNNAISFGKVLDEARLLCDPHTFRFDLKDFLQDIFTEIFDRKLIDLADQFRDKADSMFSDNYTRSLQSKHQSFLELVLDLKEPQRGCDGNDSLWAYRRVTRALTECHLRQQHSLGGDAQVLSAIRQHVAKMHFFFLTHSSTIYNDWASFFEDQRAVRSRIPDIDRALRLDVRDALQVAYRLIRCRKILIGQLELLIQGMQTAIEFIDLRETDTAEASQ